MDDRMSPDDQRGDAGGGGNMAGGGRNGRTRGGQVNTSAWLIGALVVIIAVFAGLRFTRVPAPTRPAPTVPAPTPSTPTRPAPTTPAPATTDLERSITRIEDSIRGKDWAAADSEATRLRTTWESLRPRVSSANTTKDVSMFEARVDKLKANIKAKNEAGAKADIAELKTLAKKFKVAPTTGPTSG